MPQNIRHLLDRAAAFQQAARQAVAQCVCAGVCQTDPMVGIAAPQLIGPAPAGTLDQYFCAASNAAEVVLEGQLLNVGELGHVDAEQRRTNAAASLTRILRTGRKNVAVAKGRSLRAMVIGNARE